MDEKSHMKNEWGYPAGQYVCSFEMARPDNNPHRIYLTSLAHRCLFLCAFTYVFLMYHYREHPEFTIPFGVMAGFGVAILLGFSLWAFAAVFIGKAERCQYCHHRDGEFHLVAFRTKEISVSESVHSRQALRPDLLIAGGVVGDVTWRSELQYEFQPLPKKALYVVMDYTMEIDYDVNLLARAGEREIVQRVDFRKFDIIQTASLFQLSGFYLALVLFWLVGMHGSMQSHASQHIYRCIVPVKLFASVDTK